MNDIIKVNYDSGKPLVSGRELHEALGIETPYHKWFQRMCEYGFSEDKDFWTKMSESTGGRPSTDHEISLGMAKELCMIQRSEIGKRFREYFIGIEKAWNDPTPGTIARDKSRRIAAFVVDYFKNDDNRRAFELWRGERRRTNRHELHEEPAL